MSTSPAQYSPEEAGGGQAGDLQRSSPVPWWRSWSTSATRAARCPWRHGGLRRHHLDLEAVRPGFRRADCDAPPSREGAVQDLIGSELRCDRDGLVGLRAAFQPSGDIAARAHSTCPGSAGSGVTAGAAPPRLSWCCPLSRWRRALQPVARGLPTPEHEIGPDARSAGVAFVEETAIRCRRRSPACRKVPARRVGRRPHRTPRGPIPKDLVIERTSRRDQQDRDDAARLDAARKAGHRGAHPALEIT